MDGNNLDDNVNVSNRMSDSCQIISIEGIFVYQNMQDVKEKINKIFKETDCYIFDFTRTTKIDSTGFGLLFNLVKRKPAGLKLVSVVSDPFIKELFNITKINQLIPVADSIEEALKLVKKLKSVN